MILPIIFGLKLSVTHTVVACTSKTLVQYSCIVTKPVHIPYIYPGFILYNIKYSWSSAPPRLLLRILPYTIPINNPTMTSSLWQTEIPIVTIYLYLSYSTKKKPFYISFVWTNYSYKQRPKVCPHFPTDQYTTFFSRKDT